MLNTNPTCFVTKLPPSGSFKTTKDHKSNMQYFVVPYSFVDPTKVLLCVLKVVNSFCLLGVFEFCVIHTVHFLTFHLLTNKTHYIKYNKT